MREQIIKKMKAKGFMTVKEAAAKAGVPRSTMYDWLKRGYVTSRKIGGGRFVDKSSLADHLKPMRRP